MKFWKRKDKINRDISISTDILLKTLDEIKDILKEISSKLDMLLDTREDNIQSVDIIHVKTRGR